MMDMLFENGLNANWPDKLGQSVLGKEVFYQTWPQAPDSRYTKCEQKLLRAWRSSLRPGFTVYVPDVFKECRDVSTTMIVFTPLPLFV